jgi:hypothetical protein
MLLVRIGHVKLRCFHAGLLLSVWCHHNHLIFSLLFAVANFSSFAPSSSLHGTHHFSSADGALWPAACGVVSPLYYVRFRQSPPPKEVELPNWGGGLIG